MDRWMDIDGWIAGWMDGWIDRWMAPVHLIVVVLKMSRYRSTAGHILHNSTLLPQIKIPCNRLVGR